MIGPRSTGTKTITSIDVHAEGEVGRILLGAHLLVRGNTWPERTRWCETQLAWLRRRPLVALDRKIVVPEYGTITARGRPFRLLSSR